MQTLDDEEQEKCWTGMELFEVLCDKLKTQQSKTILSLKHCKLAKEQDEYAKEWIDHLRIRQMNVSIRKKTED